MRSRTPAALTENIPGQDVGLDLSIRVEGTFVEILFRNYDRKNQLGR